MKNTNYSRFLKTAAFVLAFGILSIGTLTNEKNADLFAGVDADLSQAKVVGTEAIPVVIGKCVQNDSVGTLSALQPSTSLFATVDSIDEIVTGTASFDTQAMDALASAVSEGRVEAKILEPGTRYKFAVKDGQVDFWKCVLKRNQLFSSVVEATGTNAVQFFTKTKTFASIVDEFEYILGGTKQVDQFLNFVELPEGNQVLESTIFNSQGEVFFKIFEVELQDNISYNDLRQELRNRVGVTNLRPAVFGADSYYWMWGEDNKMAASVLWANGKVFGVSYQTIHFRHVRRVIDMLQDELDLMTDKVEYLQNLKGDEYDNLTFTGFEALDISTLNSYIQEGLKQIENADALLNSDSDLNLEEEDVSEAEPIDTEMPDWLHGADDDEEMPVAQ